MPSDLPAKEIPRVSAHFHLCLQAGHTVNKNTSCSEFNSKDCIFTKPFTVSSPILCLWNYLNSLVHTWAVSLVAILSLRVQLPWATPFLVSFTRGGAWLLPPERSVPCYFNPLWDDLFNKCLSLFSCRPLCEQTEHVFCFPQIKESIREGATEKEREITGPYMDLYYVDFPFFFPVDIAKCSQLQ